MSANRTRWSSRSSQRFSFIALAIGFGLFYNLKEPCDDEQTDDRRVLINTVRELKKVDDDEVRSLDPDLVEKICPSALSMLEILDASVSFKVVNCFLGIMIFQLVFESMLERLEAATFQTVYAAVIHKTYKELMILGFLTFVIFFITTVDSITATFVASFKYANFCLFFVGMAFTLQSLWSCLANFVIKLFIYKALYIPTKELHENFTRTIKKRCSLPFLTFSHGATRMQLLRNIFLSTYDLPDEFSFPHYFSAALDGVTEDLVELLPSSYFFLMGLIFFCEYIVRHYPYDYDSFRHPTRRESIPEFDAIFLYGLIGATIFFTYLYLHFICTRATDAIIEHKFPTEMAAAAAAAEKDGSGQKTNGKAGKGSKAGKGPSRDARLAAALASTMANGGLRHSRSLAKVRLDLKPLMHESKNAGAEELEEMSRRRREHVKAELAKAEREGLSSRASLGGGGGRASVHANDDEAAAAAAAPRGSVQFMQGGGGEDEDRGGSYRGGSSEQGASGGRGVKRKSSRRSVAQVKHIAKRASTVASAAATTVVKVASKTREEKKADREAAKLNKEANHMAKIAARSNSKHQKGATALLEQLKSTDIWMNANTEMINKVVREKLPGKSIKGIRRFIDSLRLVSNFYVAIYICTFIAESHIAENMTTLTRAGNLVGLFTVIVANTLLDPLVTFEYSTIRTMGIINPLLVGETLEAGVELDRLKQQVALKILVHWRNAADPTFDEATYVPTREHLKGLVQRAFDDWDADQGGSLDETEFQEALERAGIFFSASQAGKLFRAIECFQYKGSIDFEEFWSTFGPVLVKTLEEIQGTATFEPYTNNIDETMASLEDLQISTRKRRMLKLAKAEAKAEEDALLDNDDEGEPEDKFLRLLAYAAKGKLTRDQALKGAKFLQALRAPPPDVGRPQALLHKGASF